MQEQEQAVMNYSNQSNHYKIIQTKTKISK